MNKFVLSLTLASLALGSVFSVPAIAQTENSAPVVEEQPQGSSTTEKAAPEHAKKKAHKKAHKPAKHHKKKSKKAE